MSTPTHCARLQRIDLPDAEVFYSSGLSLPAAPEHLLERLIAETEWRQEQITLWGKRYEQPRLIAWYGDPQRCYLYSGLRLTPTPWTELLLQLKCAAERIAAAQFNSVLLNYYRDHRDSMGLHSDDEPELGPHPVIASLSFGAARPFMMRHKTRKDLRSARLILASGSVLLMRGETQRHWKHGVPKLTRSCGPRVNLTFRQIVR